MYRVDRLPRLHALVSRCVGPACEVASVYAMKAMDWPTLGSGKNYENVRERVAGEFLETPHTILNEAPWVALFVPNMKKGLAATE